MPLDETLVAQLDDTMTVEVDGKPALLREQPFFKETPDFKTFAKSAYEAHREVGARIPLKTDGKPESIAKWKEENLPKFYKAGILTPPPATPEEYVITRPANIPDGFGWNDGLAKELGTILHKHGVSKDAVPDLLALHEKTINGASKVLNTSMEAGMAALRAEHGAKFDERMELTKRFQPLIFKTPEEIEFFDAAGLGNHPAFLSIMMRLAPYAQQDSSLIRDMGTSGDGSATTRDDVRAEVADIMFNVNNPKYKLYYAKDQATMDYIDGLYKKLAASTQKAV